MAEPLRIDNHGPLILATNFWDLPVAKAGKFYLSLNAGAFRLLVPAVHEPLVAELATGKEVVISRGPWPAEGLADAFEVLFDDGSPDPFALHLAPESLDRIPPDEDAAKEWVLSVWTQPRRGRPHKALERPCWYRRSARLPDLTPRRP